MVFVWRRTALASSICFLNLFQNVPKVTKNVLPYDRQKLPNCYADPIEDSKKFSYEKINNYCFGTRCYGSNDFGSKRQRNSFLVVSIDAEFTQHCGHC